MIASLANPIKILETYEPNNHSAVYFSERGYYETGYSGIEKSKNKYKTIRSCLELNSNFSIQEEVKYPDEIEGIKKDIPFNYFSTAELSSKFLYSVIYNDWEILKYQSEPDNIKVELIKDGITCRIVIYKNYLKVYQKEEM